jgi:hypothetical protein
VADHPNRREISDQVSALERHDFSYLAEKLSLPEGAQLSASEQAAVSGVFRDARRLIHGWRRRARIFDFQRMTWPGECRAARGESNTCHSRRTMMRTSALRLF